MTAASPRSSRDRNATAQRLALWLRGIVAPLVADEQRLEVESVWAENTLALVIRAADTADLGRLIGKGGHTVSALRRLLGVAGARCGVNAVLDVSLNGRGAPSTERL